MCNREELTEINKKSKENVQHTQKKNLRSKIIFCNSVTTDHAKNITARHKKITWCFEKALPMYITDLK